MSFPTLLECIKLGAAQISETILKNANVSYSNAGLWIKFMRTIVSFYSQSLAIWMFIAVDSEGKPMKEPKLSDPEWKQPHGVYFDQQKAIDFSLAQEEFTKASKRVLFLGWEMEYRDADCFEIHHR